MYIRITRKGIYVRTDRAFDHDIILHILSLVMSLQLLLTNIQSGPCSYIFVLSMFS